MLDMYICGLSANEPTALEEGLAFMVQQLDDVPDAADPGLAGTGLPEAMEAVDLLAEGLRDGSFEGLSAYVNGQPTALCIWGRGRGGGTRSIVCFLVEPRYERHGLGARLLEDTCALLAQRGHRFVEGYPRKARPGARYTPALRAFLDAGFVPVGEQGDRVVVRKALQKEQVRKVG